MGLRVWLPLNGDLTNLGLDPVVATNNGATVDNNGKIGKCYSFDGNDDYIISSPAPLTNNSQEWSFTCWFKPNVSHQGCLFSNRTSVNSTGITIFYYTSQFYIDDGSRWQVTPSIAVTVGAWNHLAVVRKAGAYKKLYLNGVLINETTTTGTPTTATTSTFSIGASQTSPTAASGNQFNGYLNDVRIYDHCLSPLEVKEISQGLVLHYKLNGWYFGGNENLLKDTKKEVSHIYNSSSLIYYYFNFSGNLPVDTYTFSFDIKSTNGIESCYCSYANGASTINRIATLTNIPSTYTHYTYTFTSSGTNCNDIFFAHYTGHGKPTNTNNTGTIYVKNVKLEKGNMDTGWSPAPSDTTKVVDSSGYNHIGIANNITYTLDAPRYEISSVFNGTNSYVKINDNNWMVQGATAFTVNIWAKATTWPTNGGRIISCTETGGFNLEAGNTGYWRFPIHVYTNAALTSTSYQYDSKEITIADLIPNEWNMITLVYDTTGTKTYINGVLNHTYTKASYGIHFNTNARMFLGCEANTANPTSPYFNGQESDFRFYYTALSEEDIRKLYEISANIDNFGKFHSYEFNESIGTQELFADWTSWVPTNNSRITYNKNEGLKFINNCSVIGSGTYSPKYYEIKNSGYTYQYDIEYSNTEGNLFYIGFEKYDKDKTATSNNSCVYIASSKTAHNKTRLIGTVNLATDALGGTVRYIRPRILNNWSGSDTTSDSNVGIITHFSLREVPSTGNQHQKIYKNGIVSCEQLLEYDPINFAKDGFIEANEFIEY